MDIAKTPAESTNLSSHVHTETEMRRPCSGDLGMAALNFPDVREPVWWYTPVISAPTGRRRQENRKFKVKKQVLSNGENWGHKNI